MRMFGIAKGLMQSDVATLVLIWFGMNAKSEISLDNPSDLP